MKNTFTKLFILCYTIGFSQTWSTGADIPQGFRASNVAAHVINSGGTDSGYLYLVSGRDSNGNITPRNQRYSLTNNTWTDVAPAPTGILGASIAVVKDTIYVIGGLTSTPGNAIKKVRKYNINQNTWSNAADYPVNTVDTDAVAYQDSLIYVTAGYNSRVRVFNTIKNRWRDATAMTTPLQSIAWGALSVHGNKLVYMCGTDNFFSPNVFTTVRIGTIDQTNRANITWITATPFPGQTRTFFDAHSWQNGIIMTGGSTDNSFGTNSNECYFYNVDADTWTQLSSKPTSWVTGNSASLFVDNQWKLICASGYNNLGYLLNTEIFSSGVLSNNDFDRENQCSWKNFNFLNSFESKIEFCLQTNESIEINIHNINGALIKTIPRKNFEIGKNQIAIQKDNFSSGLYLITLNNGSESISKKILLE